MGEVVALDVTSCESFRAGWCKYLCYKAGCLIVESISWETAWLQRGILNAFNVLDCRHTAGRMSSNQKHEGRELAMRLFVWHIQSNGSFCRSSEAVFGWRLEDIQDTIRVPCIEESPTIAGEYRHWHEENTMSLCTTDASSEP